MLIGNAIPVFLLAPAQTIASLIIDEYTVITVTHNMQQAARISQQTAFVLNGKLG